MPDHSKISAYLIGFAIVVMAIGRLASPPGSSDPGRALREVAEKQNREVAIELAISVGPAPRDPNATLRAPVLWIVSKAWHPHELTVTPLTFLAVHARRATPGNERRQPPTAFALIPIEAAYDVQPPRLSREQPSLEIRRVDVDGDPAFADLTIRITETARSRGFEHVDVRTMTVVDLRYVDFFDRSRDQLIVPRRDGDGIALAVDEAKDLVELWRHRPRPTIAALTVADVFDAMERPADRLD